MHKGFSISGNVDPVPGSQPVVSDVVSRSLADEVKRKVRERALVVWLDAESQYQGLVDDLAKGAHDFKYPVVAFRGSYLEAMLALEGYGNGLYPDHVLVHLPGLNKETVKETPLYELYKAGTLFEKGLGTVVKEAARGLAKPDELEGLLREPELTLQKADQWLEKLNSQPRDGLGLLLETLGLDDVVMGLIAGDRRFYEHLPDGGERILDFLEKGLGLNAAWRNYRIPSVALDRHNIATLVADWLMVVEFVHDLKEEPATPELRALTKLGPYAKECRRLVARLRDQLPDLYGELASELQESLSQERTSHHANALGSIDTFRFEEEATRFAALDALRNRKWEIADSYASARTTEACFWVRHSDSLQRTWDIIRQAASAGLAFQETQKALEHCGSLEEAVERYATKLAPVDRMHRLFEQRAHAVISSDLEDYEALLEVKASLRRAYRTWTDAVNRDFYRLCVSRGTLPEPGLRQRTVYEQVVHPLVQQGHRVAFVLVDALRFEMAQGLAQELKRDRYAVGLNARLAELPTDTVIGMNALAPVEHNGRLRLVMRDGNFAGFQTGEYAVTDASSRIRAMSQRSVSGIAEDIKLEELNDLSPIQLKRRLSGRPALVVVRSQELDTAGEHRFHLGTFERTLALLKSAISLLSQAGIDRFVVASDHGFLLQDPTTENLPFGDNKRLPRRRCALLPQPSGMADVLELRLSALEYDVETDGFLVFRPDTALWQTKEQIPPFVHGGNSLQERVIPVLTIEPPGPRGKNLAKYEVVAHAEPPRMGRQRLRLAVRLQGQQTGALGFLAPKQVSLALRVPGRSDITIHLLDAGPPGRLVDGQLLLPPNRGEAMVEFALEGQFDDKVPVEIFHPDATEEVTPKIVEGFFDVARDRRLGKAQRDAGSTLEGTPTRPTERPATVTSAAAALDWSDSIEDEGYRKVLKMIEERRSLNEEDLRTILGSPRRVRSFSRQYEGLLSKIPFGVEVRTVNALKTYVRKD